MGVEGTMLMGAFTAYFVATATGSIWFAVFMAMFVGAMVGLVIAFMTVTMRVDHFITGLGVNLLTRLTEKVAAALDEDFDIEVIEAHHKHKVDAPSGTALMLGEAAAAGRGKSLDEISDRGRDGITGARKRGDIGFTAIRGGDIIGEHDVMFAALGERVILRHVASDRSVFARGAIKAAFWAKGRAAGAYDMLDVLGLN